MPPAVRVDVVATAQAVGPGALAGRTVLVVDVLRASTTIITALANGCTAVVPVADAAEARRRARRAPGPTLLAGERRGEKLPGLDLGNSPLEFTPSRVGGTTVFLTTSNGTRALIAARPAAAVGIAALVNVTAAAAWARAGGRDVVVVCAGERGAPSIEDEVCAGLVVDRLLAGEPAAAAGPAARAARARARAYGRDVARLRDDSPWARHLVELGRAADVAACLAIDTTSLVPVYRPGVDKVVLGR